MDYWKEVHETGKSDKYKGLSFLPHTDFFLSQKSSSLCIREKNLKACATEQVMWTNFWENSEIDTPQSPWTTSSRTVTFTGDSSLYPATISHSANCDQHFVLPPCTSGRSMAPSGASNPVSNKTKWETNPLLVFFSEGKI